MPANRAIAPPLEGLRVLEVATMLAAPYGATLLGDLGADVIKIESPVGDDSRHLGPTRNGECGPYLSLNRDKRGMVLDLRRSDAREAFARLLRTADILITNIREQALGGLGLAYEQVQASRPDIVWIHVSAFGPDGPYAARPGIDFLAQGYSGILALNGEPGGPPVRAGFPAVDVIASLLVANAALAAVRARDRSGVGQRVEISLLDAAMHAQASSIGSYLATGERPRRSGNRSLYFAPSGVYPTKDGGHIVITAPSDRFFGKLCRALGTAWDSEPRFATIASRLANQDELDRIIAERTRRFAREDLVARLVSADVLTAPINEIEDVVCDPQIRHNCMIVRRTHPTLGSIDITGVPIRFYGTPCAVSRHPPLQGEHTRALLAECGYGEHEVDDLIARGAAADPPTLRRLREQNSRADGSPPRAPNGAPADSPNK